MVNALTRIIAGEKVQPIQLATELVVRESSRLKPLNRDLANTDRVTETIR